MIPDLEALGRLVRECRQQLGLTQTQLGSRMGWNQERLSLLERAQYGLPSLPSLAHLASALQIPLVNILHTIGYHDGAMSTLRAAQDERSTADASLFTIQQLLTIEAVSLADAVEQAADLIVETMGADKVDVFFYEPSTSSLVALGTSHTPMGAKQHALGLNRVALVNGGRMAQAFQTGKAYVTGRTDEDPEEQRGVREALGVKSTLNVPLSVDGERRGVLSAVSARQDRFNDDDVTFFTAIAGWVGLVAHRMELSEAVAREAAHRVRKQTADELIGVVAHDLGTHLAPLNAKIEVVHRRAEAEGRQQDIEATAAALQMTRRLEHLTRDLLDVSQLDNGLLPLRLESVDLVTISRQVLERLKASDEKIQLRAPDTLVVRADPDRMSQLLENVVSNALQYSPANLPVSVDIHHEQCDDGLRAVVIVRDRGPGLAADLDGRLFDRYSLGADSTGLGLGLFLARSIADAHGGDLVLDSTTGEGTSFRFSLPLPPV